MIEAAEIVVIGGGPAGAAVAAELAAANRDVLLIERHSLPHDKVCGEFISGEALSYLVRLGIDPMALGAVPIGQLRLVLGSSDLRMALPFKSVSLSRRCLDEALLDQARAKGAAIRRGVRVMTLKGGPGAWRLRLNDGSEIHTPTVVLATGKHDLRGWSRPDGSQPDLVAFKLYWQLRPSTAGPEAPTVELYGFPHGYLGLEPVERNRTNCSLVVRARYLAEHGKDWHALLAAIRRSVPQLDERLRDAVPLMEPPIGMTSIPYGFVTAEEDGLWRVGDQAAVIPSFCGNGLSIALHSACLAASSLAAGATVETYRQRLERDVRRRIQLATLLSRTLVNPTGQRLLRPIAAIAPSLVAAVARATRLADRSLMRAPLARQH